MAEFILTLQTQIGQTQMGRTKAPSLPEGQRVRSIRSAFTFSNEIITGGPRPHVGRPKAVKPVEEVKDPEIQAEEVDDPDESMDTDDSDSSDSDSDSDCELVSDNEGSKPAKKQKRSRKPKPAKKILRKANPQWLAEFEEWKVFQICEGGLSIKCLTCSGRTNLQLTT
jgi:hypothetical protein